MEDVKQKKDAWCPKVRMTRKEYDAAYYLANKTKAKINSQRSSVKRTYGLTLEEYNKFKEKGTCDICGKPETQTKSISLDHNHVTNKIRGILCHNCNVGIGLFQESEELLSAAIRYLHG